MPDKLKNITQGPAQMQLNFYRSQSETMENKKRELAARNDALHKEVRELERRVKRKRLEDGQSAEEELDFASISATVARSTDDYEKKKLLLKAMEAERGHAVRTSAILAAENDRINKVLVSLWVSY